MNTSPFVYPDMPFALDSALCSSVVPNVFIPLGHAPKGRYNFVLFTDTCIDYQELQALSDTEQRFSSDCVHYLLRSPEKVIGVLVDVNFKKLTFSDSYCSITDSDSTELFGQLEDSLPGVIVFSDGEGTFLMVPESPNVNQYTVY